MYLLFVCVCLCFVIPFFALFLCLVLLPIFSIVYTKCACLLGDCLNARL